MRPVLRLSSLRCSLVAYHVVCVADQNYLARMTGRLKLPSLLLPGCRATSKSSNRCKPTRLSAAVLPVGISYTTNCVEGAGLDVLALVHVGRDSLHLLIWCQSREWLAQALLADRLHQIGTCERHHRNCKLADQAI